MWLEGRRGDLGKHSITFHLHGGVILLYCLTRRYRKRCKQSHYPTYTLHAHTNI
ncbi:hypothetical protein BD408DRAFT_407960 [Parasitella parasitica]|nr:hypothetical protein BD408DRAFT_407960 [Parasitella parasitica]